jgi:hypothetical protein
MSKFKSPQSESAVIEARVSELRNDIRNFLAAAGGDGKGARAAVTKFLARQLFQAGLDFKPAPGFPFEKLSDAQWS